jgi:hypothetical protein
MSLALALALRTAFGYAGFRVIVQPVGFADGFLVGRAAGIAGPAGAGSLRSLHGEKFTWSR